LKSELQVKEYIYKQYSWSVATVAQAVISRFACT